MCRCKECGKWFFNHKKLSHHLIVEHGYVIELKDQATLTITYKEVRHDYTRGMEGLTERLVPCAGKNQLMPTT